MKNLVAMTTKERQEYYRDRLKDNNGKRLSITISQEAADALQDIQDTLNEMGEKHTKRAAIETALVELAKYWGD